MIYQSELLCVACQCRFQLAPVLIVGFGLAFRFGTIFQQQKIIYKTS
jgi:hypothetical protein